jgi:hypothetical protein
MLSDYGKLVKKVELELEGERENQTRSLEEKLKQRRLQKKEEVAQLRQKREDRLNNDLQARSEKVEQDAEQVKALIKPVLNE